MINIDEITRQYILDRFVELGINPKFFENPAFKDILSEIVFSISDISIDKKIMVERKGDLFTFYVKTSDDDERHVSICCSQNNEIKIIKKTVFRSNSMRGTGLARNTIRDESIARLDLGTGAINTEKVSVHISDDLNDNSNMCGLWINGNKDEYSPEGIMLKSESRFSYVPMNMSYDRYITVGGIIDAARNNYLYNCSHFRKIDRMGLDIALIREHDYIMNTECNYVAELIHDVGLRLLIEAPGQGTKPNYIPPMSAANVDRIISMERDPRVQEGLRKLAEGRTKFSYDSAYDPNFKPYGTRK